MAYLGWQAFAQKRLGKRKGELALLFGAMALPVPLLTSLGNDWVPAAIVGTFLPTIVMPKVYEETSKFLRARSVGLTRGSRIIKAVQATTYAACLTLAFFATRPDEANENSNLIKQPQEFSVPEPSPEPN